MSILERSEILLSDDPTYSCYADCLGQNLSFYITWIERIKKRAITITAGNGDVYLQNTVINVNETIELNSKAKSAGIGGNLVLLFIPEKDTKPDYLNWSKNMFLTLYRVDEE